MRAPSPPPPNPNNDKPIFTNRLNAAMRKLWARMQTLPNGLRLYGGTAMALYLDHRYSTDFDFATAGFFDRAILEQIPWLEPESVRGGDGMLDLVVMSAGCAVKITLMECGTLIPWPIAEPIQANNGNNGVLVAHPIDLVAAKIQACIRRGALRDYEDLAAATYHWPAFSRAAIAALPHYSLNEIATAIAVPPFEVEHTLARTALMQLKIFAQSLRSEAGLER